MTRFQPADHLHSRTFIGLLVAQFLAAFNDQAIHASAMFFAINTGTMSEARAITLMPILFYAPWAIFCTVAGYLADRFSKRAALILWKVVEVGITLLALTGFWIGRNGDPSLGSYLVLSTVFLMGMHSAFFVPAKYGAMPEILTPRMLSKGNGVLESLSFLAVILGTVAGGVFSTLFLRQEYLIGVILTILAIMGALASLFIERIPAANAGRPFPPYIYQPLFKNIRALLTSRPLVFAVVGIAFFTFLVAFMRAVVYMHGQSQLPPWSEAHTSYVVGMVALGIGLGSPLVGFLSGGKVEVGLVPIGALGMMTATTVAALMLANIPVLLVCIVLIGFFTGFYLVPLFSLLQHRAPKSSKGDFIATSNFINIIGAIAASLVFGALDSAAIRTGYTTTIKETGQEIRGTLDEPIAYDETGHVDHIVVDGITYEADYEAPGFVLFRIHQGIGVGDEVVLRSYTEGPVTYIRVQPGDAPPRPMYNKSKLPTLLFLAAGAMTLVTLFLLWFFLPDMFGRARWWLAAQTSYVMEVAGLLRLPSSGPALVFSNAASAEQWTHVRRALDRVVHVLEPGSDPEATLMAARRYLDRGEVVGINDETLLRELLDVGAPILPVEHADQIHRGQRQVAVAAGSLIAPGSPIDMVREELQRLLAETSRKLAAGEPLEKEEGESARTHVPSEPEL